MQAPQLPVNVEIHGAPHSFSSSTYSSKLHGGTETPSITSPARRNGQDLATLPKRGNTTP